MHVVLAEHDRPGIPETLDDGGVEVCDVLGKDGRPAGGDPTLHRDVVFHPHRDAVERATPASLRQFGVGGFRSREGLLGLHDGEGVQLSVRRRDLFERGGDQLDG